MEARTKYATILRNARVTVKCFYCNCTLLPKFYLKHLKSRHELLFSKKTLCIWCMDAKKFRNAVQHRLKCLFRLINPPKETIEFGDFRRYLNCSECNEWRKSNPPSPPPPPHTTTTCIVCSDVPIDSSWHTLLDYKSSTDFNLDPECGIDLRWLRLYLTNSYAWLHCSVRFSVWRKFFKIVNSYPQIFCVLPYWCLCNGGQPDQPEAHHRHCIVVVYPASVDRFKSILYGFVHAREIHCLKQFLYAWRFVSTPQTVCKPSRRSEQIFATKIIEKYNSENLSMVLDYINYSSPPPPPSVDAMDVRTMDSTSCPHMLSNAHLNSDATIAKSDHHSLPSTTNYYIAKPMIPHCLLAIAMGVRGGQQTIAEMLKMRTDITILHGIKQAF